MLSLLFTALIGIGAFHMNLSDVLNCIGYGLVKAFFPILYIITMAMFSYNLMQRTGQMNIIKQQISSVTDNRSLQVLLITWGFGGLLEAMAGFGTAETICISILIGLGFKPLFSAVICLLANSVITAFGAVGTPIVVLAKETGINASLLGVNIVTQLAVFMFLFPFTILTITSRKRKDIPRNILVALLVGSTTLCSQYLVVTYMGIEAPSIISSLCSILVILIYSRLCRHNTTSGHSSWKDKLKEMRAWSIYLFILILIIATSPLFSSFNHALSSAYNSSMNFRIMEQNVTYNIAWLTQSGTLLLIGTVTGGLIQKIPVTLMAGTLWNTLKQLRKVFITLVCLISLSTIMNYAGMITCIAMALASVTGTLYPLFSPAIGCLGTFITGSGTSANILFGKLQADVATQLHISPDWLAAGNMSGTTAGKIISPQSIAIVTSNEQLSGKESVVLKKAFPYALIYVILIGFIVYLFG